MEEMEGREMNFEELESFYRGKRVLLTGHTGFKGSWLSLLLRMLGAEVYGYALPAPTEPNLFSILGIEEQIHSEYGDIRDFEHLRRYFAEAEPELVLHLAAQPIVRDSYLLPRETYETNVMGTVNLLECVRQIGGVRSLLNVTTDKVYENPELAGHAFREEEKLDGFDPYSNSKSCSELVTHSYQRSFFPEPGEKADGVRIPAVSTARAGNVIGGGDFANDRIIPDCVRDTIAGRRIHVRNPYSTRPYQHVLEPLLAYLSLTALQAGFDPARDGLDDERGRQYAGCYNVGPDEEDAITTGELADRFVRCWGGGAAWETQAEAAAPHEASYLRLDCTKLREKLGWRPRWHVAEAVAETVRWYRSWKDGEDMLAFTERQIREFCGK